MATEFPTQRALRNKKFLQYRMTLLDRQPGIKRSLAFYPNDRPEEVRVLLIEFMDRLLGDFPPF